MTTKQVWVVQDGNDWVIRGRDGDGPEREFRRFADRAYAIRLAAETNALLIGAKPPVRRTATIGQQMAQLRRELGAEPILNRAGKPYAVHHSNQHTD